MRLLILLFLLAASAAAAQPETRQQCDSLGGRWTATYRDFKCALKITQDACRARGSQGWAWDKREQQCFRSWTPWTPQACKAAGGTWGQFAARTEHCFFEQRYIEQKQECADQGGAWRRMGMMGFEGCVRAARDAGKPCSDSSECEYRCLHGAASRYDGNRVVGTCAPNSSPFGCYSEILNGTPRATKCVD